jgi:succinate dehydrogenase/fumarate reductase flavoprotein subunit
MPSTAEGRWDREVDLLVAGAGAGGMAAALVASLEGLDVLVCEKGSQLGGTAATSAGTLWIPGNHESRAAGFDDTAERGRTYLDGLIPEATGRELREAFLESGPRILDDFARRTEVKFRAAGKHPDYRSNIAGASVAGRPVVAEPFDGRLLGKDFRLVRPPIAEFLVLGGMMVAKADIPHLLGRFRSARSFLYSARLVLRYLADRLRHPRGTRLVMGNALVARLFYSLRQRQVPLWLEAPVEELLRDGERVVGAAIRRAGKVMRVRARKGVVLATGGFGHNEAFRRDFLPEPAWAHSMAAETVTGDGLALGQRAGGRIRPREHRTGGLWSPVSVTRRKDGTTGLYPHILLDRAKPGLIAVNKAGRRFVDEGVSYHDFVLAMFESNRTVPTVPAWLVCDAEFIRKYGLGEIYPGTSDLARWERSGYLSCAPTLEALAAKIGVDTAGLADTVRRHNHFAATGNDLDFGKGESELGLFNGDPENKPNPGLAPIEHTPFCAVAVWPAEIAGATGLTTDADARVLAEDGTPIPGLYACGNDMASIMCGTYPGPGTTLGPALVFGWRAAMHAAKER